MENRTLSYATFVDYLLAEVPEARSAYEEHMQEQQGELLSHVLMGDVTRFFVHAYRRSVSGEIDADHWRGVVGRTLALLERAANSSDMILLNLVTVSFLENLIPSDKENGQEVEVYHALKVLLGPTLRQQMTTILEYWGFSDSYP